MSDIIWVAFGLMLVFEGLLPAVNPRLYRRMVQLMNERDDAGLRSTGLIMMAIGAVIIYIVKQ